MSVDRIFLDTNIIVYAYSTQCAIKREIARALIESGNAVVSVQVLNEFCNTTRRKFPDVFDQVEKTLQDISNFLRVQDLSMTTTRQAVTLSQRYGYSFYDSLILASALECGCNLLMSEDMQHGMVADNQLRIENPFQLA